MCPFVYSTCQHSTPTFHDAACRPEEDGCPRAITQRVVRGQGGQAGGVDVVQAQ